MEPANFKLYSQYYDLLYQDKDYDAETAYIITLIREFSPACQTILELGSGTFKHARRLVNAGYRVHGVEQSSGMIEMAGRESLNGLSWELADIGSYRSEAKFDLAISLFHVISYLTDNDKLISTFKRVHQSLNENGIFIFDAWYTPAVYTEVPQPRIKQMNNKELSVIRKAEPVIHYETNVVDVHYDIQIHSASGQSLSSISEVHPMRHFCGPEIQLLALHCGFKVLRSEEFQTGKAPGADTWGVCYILKKA